MNKELYSKEVEENILGCLIVFESCRRYIKSIEVEDFYIEVNKKIFEMIQELDKSAKPISLLSIKELAKDKKLKAEEVFKYLLKITEVIITSEEINYYITRLKNHSTKRQILKKTKEINDYIYTSEFDIEPEMVKKKCLTKLAEVKTNVAELKDSDMTSVMTLATKNIEKRYQKRNDHTYETGFFELDKATNGLHEQELTIIGARPGTGKTSLALNIAERLSAKGVVTYFVSLEMSKQQLANRMIASRSGIDSHKIRSGWLEAEDWAKIGKVSGELAELKMIIDTKSTTIEEVELRATELRERKGIGLIVVDYLQLLHSKSKYSIREQEVAEISRKLKLLSRELEIPVIALCQLNRESEKRKRPALADLRESGSLEQDADNVIFIYKSEDEEGVILNMELIIAKQRNGGTGTVKVRFNSKTTTFMN